MSDKQYLITHRQLNSLRTSVNTVTSTERTSEDKTEALMSIGGIFNAVYNREHLYSVSPIDRMADAFSFEVYQKISHLYENKILQYSKSYASLFSWHDERMTDIFVTDLDARKALKTAIIIQFARVGVVVTVEDDVVMPSTLTTTVFGYYSDSRSNVFMLPERYYFESGDESNEYHDLMLRNRFGKFD